MPTKKSCNNCLWAVMDTDAPSGVIRYQCHRYPPEIAHPKYESEDAYPITSSRGDYWCGEWVKKN